VPEKPFVQPSDIEVVEEEKPKVPEINIATGESEEQSKKKVTMESYAPIDKIDIGGKSFPLPIQNLPIEEDEEPPPPLPERKVAPAEDVANLMT